MNARLCLFVAAFVVLHSVCVQSAYIVTNYYNNTQCSPQYLYEVVVEQNATCKNVGNGVQLSLCKSGGDTTQYLSACQGTPSPTDPVCTSCTAPVAATACVPDSSQGTAIGFSCSTSTNPGPYYNTFEGINYLSGEECPDPFDDLTFYFNGQCVPVGDGTSTLNVCQSNGAIGTYSCTDSACKTSCALVANPLTPGCVIDGDGSGGSQAHYCSPMQGGGNGASTAAALSTAGGSTTSKTTTAGSTTGAAASTTTKTTTGATASTTSKTTTGATASTTSKATTAGATGATAGTTGATAGSTTSKTSTTGSPTPASTTGAPTPAPAPTPSSGAPTPSSSGTTNAPTPAPAPATSQTTAGGGSTQSTSGGSGGGSTQSTSGGSGGGSTQSTSGGSGSGSTQSTSGGSGSGSTQSTSGGSGSTQSNGGSTTGGSNGVATTQSTGASTQTTSSHTNGGHKTTSAVWMFAVLVAVMLLAH